MWFYMSSDLYNLESISVIESCKSQDGPPGTRMLLGPIHVANHDCKPNCQVLSTFTLRGDGDNNMWYIIQIRPILLSFCSPTSTSSEENLSLYRTTRMGIMARTVDVRHAIQPCYHWHQSHMSLRVWTPRDQKSELVEGVAEKQREWEFQG